MELAAAYFEPRPDDDRARPGQARDRRRPDLGEAFNLRGLIYANLGDERWPRRASAARCSSTPRDADTMQNFGWYLCQQKRYAEANALFNQALAVPQLSRRGAHAARRRASARRAPASCGGGDALVRSYELEPATRRPPQPRRSAVPARRIRAGALLHPPRQCAAATLSNAQTLWLAARIEQKLGNHQGAQDSATSCSDRFPDRARRGRSSGARSMSEASRRSERGAPTAGGCCATARRGARACTSPRWPASIKVAPRKLEALEADRFDELPDATFTRALAQTVCRALKIDADAGDGVAAAAARPRLEQLGEGLNTPFATTRGGWCRATGLDRPRRDLGAGAAAAGRARGLPDAAWRLSRRVTRPTIAAPRPPAGACRHGRLPCGPPRRRGSEERRQPAPRADRRWRWPRPRWRPRPAAMAAAAPLGSAASEPAPRRRSLQLQAIATSWIEVTTRMAQPLHCRAWSAGGSASARRRATAEA